MSPVRNRSGSRCGGATAVSVAITALAIAALTGIFFFQNALVRRPLVYTWVRRGFLVFTLVWLGWYANAQLSVVNVLTFTNALVTGFSWDYFLTAPLIFMLWSSVAISLLFWGRGPFCGWLCPFGALQELTNTAAKAMGVPQLRVAWDLHERLWPIKYVDLPGLVRHVALLDRRRRAARRGRTFQDRDHLEVRARLAVRGVRRGAARQPDSSSSASSAATCVRSAPLSQSRAACGCSNGCGVGPSAARRASAAPTSVRCNRSTPKGTSTSTNAFTACTARSCTGTTSDART